jgi:hypothetical protein
MTTLSGIMMSFPVDDHVLTLLEDAMRGGFEVDPDGTHRLVGAEFTVNKLLDFYSGYNPENVVNEVYLGTLYTKDDVIRALIAEVRRLRALALGHSFEDQAIYPELEDD